MTETTHTRSRRAALGGLAVQLVMFAGALVLAHQTNSQATYNLAWLALGGLPLWFVSLLVFRQHELAELERLDLDELRREKAVSGGGEAMFSEESGALGFRVAHARLLWMQRWLLPLFGFIAAAYLATAGFLFFRYLFFTKGAVDSANWPVLTRLPVAMVVLSILLLGGFLMSRYASGLARAPAWQLLRGCGSFLLACVGAVAALLIAQGVALYTHDPTWERLLAFAIPALMMLLAAETLSYLVLDIYRPRLTGVEPRASFDSRLLALFAEPGGVAQSIADAINYQFGVSVSQTWFYRLLERTFLPLLGAGVAAVWLLTCIVIVQPYEHVVVERFGRQLNAHAEGSPAPYGPGIHFKAPWPIDVARTYNTGQLHQISVGWKLFDAQPAQDPNDLGRVQLWTDEKHRGLEHFDFVTCPPAELDTANQAAAESPAAGERSGAAPVNMIRMEVTVQFRIKAEAIARYTRVMADPERAVRNAAWQEVTQFNASTTVEYLLGGQISEISGRLRERIARRLDEYGLDVVYVGVTNVHPENTVATAYRDVIGAELQRVAAIREARVIEDQRLSAATGDAAMARRLADRTARLREATERLNAALGALVNVGSLDVVAELERLSGLRPLQQRVSAAAAALDGAREQLRQIEEDVASGMGRSTDAIDAAREGVRAAERDSAEAEKALAARRDPLGAQLSQRFPAAAAALLAASSEQAAVELWESELNAALAAPSLGGRAAAAIAGASSDRWKIETSAASSLARVELEREANRAAPNVYRSMRLMEVIRDGIKDARKYFLAFDPGDREVRVRLVAEDRPGDVLDLTRVSPNKP